MTLLARFSARHGKAQQMDIHACLAWGRERLDRLDELAAERAARSE